MSTPRTISRAALVRIVEKATEGVTPSTRERLLRVASKTDAFAVGWFHCDGVRCPARQAGRTNQLFQRAFDEAMNEHFGVEFGSTFVVRVEAEASS